MREMNNLELLLAKIKEIYYEKIDADLPMEQVAHLVGHIALEEFQKLVNKNETNEGERNG